MPQNDVKEKYFSGLDQEPAAPLYLILRKRIKQFIEDHPDQTPFPSERELSELLNVNRRTLRKALEPFLADGSLKRVKHETFVSGGNNAPSNSAPLTNDHSEQPHPFTEFAISQKRKLRILLYEPLPFQQAFWKHVIEKFNQMFPMLELEAFYPPGVPESKFAIHQASYWETFSTQKFDLANLPVSYLWTDAVQTSARPQESAMIEWEQSDSFLTGTIASSTPDLLQYAVPFAYNFMLNNWHMEKRRFLNCPPGTSFEKILTEAVRKLPEETAFFTGYYDLCRDLGVLEEFTPEQITDQCRTILRRLDIFRNRKRQTPVPCTPWTLMNDSPKGVLYAPQFSMVRALGDGELLQDYEPELITPRAGCKYWGGFLSLMVHKNTEHIHEVKLFLNYMLSEPVQEILWDRMKMAPLLRSALHTISIAPPEQTENFLLHCRENPRENPPPVGVVMLPAMEDYLAGKITAEKIICDTLHFYSI